MKLRLLRGTALCAGLWLGALSNGFGQPPGSTAAPVEPQLVPFLEKPKGQATVSKGEAAQPKAPEPPPSFWEKVPPVRVFPRLGNFPNPPAGAGYYSVKDCLEGNFREAPPRFPYPAFALMPPSFFDADFRYLESPKNTQFDCFDPLKRVHLGCDWWFSTGGQFWWRSMHEVSSRLTGRTNDYDLLRTRVYGDLWYRDQLRFFVEFLDAHSFNQDLDPLPIDRNRADLLNAFVDVKIADIDGKPAYVRVGRQELLLGSQRLISPLDWANTRRTFNGIRAFRQGEKNDLDLFWLQPVVPDPSNFDSVDNNQNFLGAWYTHRPRRGTFLDAYYLWLDNTNRVTRQGITAAPFNVHTLGGRYAGDQDGFLWDVEAALQLGDRGNQSIVAGMFSAGAGYHGKGLSWNPTLWAYYDYASGDNSPNRGNHSTTFNQLFPFGHYYLGWIDLVGRQNIHDTNLHLFLYPKNWVTVWMQYHHFWLASRHDALYNAAGSAYRRDATGRAGRNVGDELDLILNFHVDQHQNILLGYSVLFPGHFIRRTGSNDTAELFYASYVLRW